MNPSRIAARSGTGTRTSTKRIKRTKVDIKAEGAREIREMLNRNGPEVKKIKKEKLTVQINRNKIYLLGA